MRWELERARFSIIHLQPHVIDLSHVYFIGEKPQPSAAPRSARRSGAGHRAKRLPDSEATKPKDRFPAQSVSPLIAFVLKQSGLNLQDYQAKPLHRRLGACLRKLRVPTEEAAITLLSRAPEQLPSALSALLIGVSGFFRDSEIFEYLQERVFPQALPNGGVRVYSFGCSAGQELFSVAMILDELGVLTDSHLLGVDCRSDAIEQAAAGRFGLSDLEPLDRLRAERYFQTWGGYGFVVPRLRERMRWAKGKTPEYLPAEMWDVIFFRNVAIYLDPSHAWELWRRLEQQLKPGGALITGMAERPPAPLGLVRESSCVYRKSK